MQDNRGGVTLPQHREHKPIYGSCVGVKLFGATTPGVLDLHYSSLLSK